ncbi:MAG: glutamate N-acetyltransferase/amino-acid N-acetyltransferase [Mariniblastus sp.]|jgi:glutamate N-acetyltransferase/amino-acid N-acetyltransferase
MSLPHGFLFNGVACGIKASGKSDLAIVATERDCVAAGVYTQNVVRAASIDWNRNLTPTGNLRAVVVNSGNANACTGQQGTDDNQTMAAETAALIGCTPQQVLVLSTGVIGHTLPMDCIIAGIAAATPGLGAGMEDFELAANAILTTDKSAKTIHQSIEVNGQTINISGMAKGAGMIGPNMATMLAVMTTDAKLTLAAAQTILQSVADASFNRISVEGHTSTNDALLLLCSGESTASLESETELKAFESALTKSCIELAKRIPADGEGATHLIEINVVGAGSVAEADQVARTIAASALVKTAVTGADPNWGRIVSAAGYSGISMNVGEIDLHINGHCVFRGGQPVKFDAATVSQAMAGKFETNIDLRIGNSDISATHWTSDLTVEYVRFNSEYTT